MPNPAEYGFDPYAGFPDTGSLWGSIKKGVSSAAHAVTKVAAAPGKLALSAAKAAHIPGAQYAVYALAPQTIATKMGGQVIASTLNSIANPNLKALAANAQNILRNSGPVGMIASGAVGAMAAGLSGKNIEAIAWAAAEGAAPSGIDTAIRAAESLRHGQSVLTTALTAAQSSFVPGSTEKFGFDTAVKTLRETANKAALGVARSALPSEGARRAFDTAVGVIAQGAKGAPSLSSLVPRAGGIPSINLTKAISKISAVPSATKGVLDAIKRNPAMLAGNRQLIAQAMRTNAATVNDAMRIAGKNANSFLPWRSLDSNTVNFIRKYVPNASLAALRHAHTNVGGLDSSGTVYLVEKGDGPWAIAQKLTGNGNRWKELLPYNRDKKPAVDKNIWVGESLNLPPTWQQPVAKTAPPKVALPAVPSPTIAPTLDPVVAVTQATTSVIPSILQAKAILAAWGKTDGINQAGLSDYGLNPADMSTTMGPRDTMMLQSFQVWDNKTLQDGLQTSGDLDAKTLQALQAWASSRANQSATPSTPVVSAGQSNALPTVIPAGVIGGTDSNPAAPKVATAASPASGGSGGIIAGGAIIGGLLFGVPGALIGGAAGAALS